MFLGEYKHSIDDKGRVAVPSKFRSSLKDGAVVTRGLDDCLFLYPISEWKKFADKLSQVTITQSDSRAFTRHMLSGAMDVNIDKQGRIVLPDYLRVFADIKKNVVLAGLYNRVEIWNEDKWNKYKDITEKDSVKIAERMTGIGI
ncbi:MAG: division/cell wall cluster transcriptional repressor MraZ [Patescibacteria group bacterium]|mgnify:CR=1 FL=1